MSTFITQPSHRLARVALRSKPITCHRYMTASTAAREVPMPSDVPSNWYTHKTLPLSRQNIRHLFQNRIPDIRARKFLSADECQSLVKIIKTQQIGSYNENVFPPIGSVGITQFDHQNDKSGYFSKVNQARTLQNRFREEANIDVVGRVRDILQRTTGLPVRIAQDDDRDYFAGLLRLINRSALLHADFGPYDGPQWEIGNITAQITWNILLKQVDGGESTVYDRPWQGAKDDAKFKNLQSYGYSHKAVEGCASKSMKYDEGDLHFFNSRNFHEVKALSSTAEESRYTMSSFVGLLPNFWPGQPGLILWS